MMTNVHPSRWSRQLKRASQIACLLVIGLGCLVVLGWLFDIDIFKSVVPGKVTMKANTALSLIIGGASLWWYGHRGEVVVSHFSWAFYLLPGLIIILSLLTLVQYAFGVDLGIDQILFQASANTVDAAAPGRMAPNTAFSFLLVNCAVGLLTKRFYRTAQALAVLVFLVAFLSLIGHAYDIVILYGVGSFTGMAVHTAIAFILLSLALLGAHPTQGWMRVVTSDEAGGLMVRRLLPVALMLPPILGWLVLLGFQKNLYGAKLGTALRSIAEVLIFGWGVWWTARRLNQIDRQRQQVSQALLDSERRFRAIFNQTFQFIGLLAPDGTLLEVNQTALNVANIARSDVVGKPIWEGYRWSTSATQEQLKQAIARAAQGEFIRYEVEIRANERPLTIDFSLRPVKEGEQVVLIIPEGRDITELKQIEEQLRQSEERFRRAFEDAATGEALVAPNGRFVRVNRALRELLGYSEAELLAKTFQDITHPDDLNTDLGYVQQMLAGEIRTYQMEKRYFHKQGQIIWILLSVSLVRNAQKPLYFVSQIQDITERKHAQAQLHTLITELERSNQELEEFASVVSHDLLAPLHKHQMLGELLQEDYGEDLGEEGRNYLKRMRTVTSRMQILIKDLLTYSRVATQARPFVPVELTAVIKGVLSDLEAEINQTNGRVEIGLLPTIEADPVQMRQLFQNLLSNALKFHHPHILPFVKIYQESEKNFTGLVQIVVEDNGIGFKPEYAQKIFTPFHRLHSSSHYEGTGLGLAICRKIVERHRGTITASSTPLQGARFTITLPSFSIQN